MPSSEDATRIYRTRCLRRQGHYCRPGCGRDYVSAMMGICAGLLFVVGEERDSLGPRSPTRTRAAHDFLVNGEPTGNRIALASKGALRVEIVASGKMAHSAYPGLGESAIDKLLDALASLARHAAAHQSRDWLNHDEYRNHRRRTRHQRHPGLRQSTAAVSPGRLHRRHFASRSSAAVGVRCARSISCSISLTCDFCTVPEFPP